MRELILMFVLTILVGLALGLMARLTTLQGVSIGVLAFIIVKISLIKVQLDDLNKKVDDFDYECCGPEIWEKQYES